MISKVSSKYRPFPPVHLPDRQWPDRVLTHAPIWCSVDLRDGNQALPVPMNVAQKLELFGALVKCGFKEIEVGFPSASNTEYEFMRRLIEEERIPEDVSIQVLVQAREDLIERTVESLVGAKRAIIHLYNSTSPAQRRYVFGMEKPEIVEVARHGTQWIKERLGRLKGADVMFQYSPESFSATEVEFSLEICEAVMETWQPRPGERIILNLPDTVEVAMPNVYADQIEWFCNNLKARARAIVSVHTHNDRGTGVAATELALLAGAERVEGTLFGNGERTGNLDIVIVALNLYMHGIDPKLDFSDLNAVREVYENSTKMSVPPRQPYAGELVFTAFSGSHQDAIKKGLAAMAARQKAGETPVWDVPYLTVDPADIGRHYREVIRVNSQSGKGGVAYLLESEFGIVVPKEMQREFGPLANDEVDRLGREVTGAELREFFWREYIEQTRPLALVHCETETRDGIVHCKATVSDDGTTREVEGQGNGPIAAFVKGLAAGRMPGLEVADYISHALSFGAEASAIAYVQIKLADGRKFWGAAVDTNIELAPIKALLSAVNRSKVRGK
ncbi:MAG: 2-isopropylmalate synthase [Chthoniobacteraceae bacterium]|jgi:2-isopropylmalate synthase